MKRPKLSVLVATKDRPSELARLLGSLEECQRSDFVFEVVIISNGSHKEDREVLEAAWKGFTVVPLYENVAGKSRALNHGLDVSLGELIVFTDDDIVPDPSWLIAIYRGSLRYPAASVFCGPIIPVYPPDIPEWMRYHRYSDAMFARFEPNLREGTLPDTILPFGGNFAVRRCAIQGHRFSLQFGPSADNGPLLGEDVEFLHRLRSDHKEFIFLPDAAVRHMIVASRTKRAALFERAFHIGRSIALQDGKPRFREAPIFHQEDKLNSELVAFDIGALLNYYCGQLDACRNLFGATYELQLWQALHGLHLEQHIASLCKAALETISAPIRN